MVTLKALNKLNMQKSLKFYLKVNIFQYKKVQKTKSIPMCFFKSVYLYK